MKIFNKLLIFFIIIVSNNLILYACDNHIPVRVGISNTNFSSYLFDNIEFLNANSLRVIDAASGYNVPLDINSKILKVTSENNLYRIYVNNVLTAKNLTGPILISSTNEGVISINGLKRKGKQAFYRGSIELVRSSKDNSKFSIVNVLSLKNYLKGVVPNEMPVKFGLEALKAQTVAARNYAVSPRLKAYKEFDLCDSVACQVYYGANTEDPLANQAIEETTGIIAIDQQNNPILALYSSTAGGYTESYEYAFSDPETKEFPSKDISYLQAVPDNKKFNTLETEREAENFYTSSPAAFDDESPYYRWSKEWTKPELEKVLSVTLPAQSKTGFISPAAENSKDVGKIISIKPLQRGKSGKIIKLEIKTNKNTYIVQKELVIRRCFQKNGISLPSANFVINYIDSQTPVYKFSGGGFGHGVGLSQWGSGKMAKLGYSYIDILQHYYKGIKLATIPVKVINNRKSVERFFFSDNQNAKLFIQNNDAEGRLIVCINEKEIDIDLKKNLTSIDISEYLQKGKNKIEYLIDNNYNDYTKSVVVYVEIKEAVNE